MSKYVRFVTECVELTQDCEVGKGSERAVVTEISGIYMTLVFHDRDVCRTVLTGTDYLFLKPR